MQRPFKVSKITNNSDLEAALRAAVQNPINTYFMCYSSWDEKSKILINRILDRQESPSVDKTLFYIDVWDVPHYVLFMRSYCDDNKIVYKGKSITSSNIPQLYAINKQTMRFVDNLSAIYSELLDG